MSITEAIGTALSGLAASQAGLKTVSNNIANVHTPGYAREKQIFTPNLLGGRSAGVQIGEVERIADRFLEIASFIAAGDVGRYQSVESYTERLQTMLGPPGDANSLSTKLDGISAAAIKMTAAGSTSIDQRAFADAVDLGLSELRRLGEDINQLQRDAATEMESTITRINSLLQRVERLNENVAVSQVLGRATAGYVDERGAVLDELGTLIALNVREQPDGRVYLETSSGMTLLDKRARALTYNSAAPGIDQAIYPPIELSFVGSNGEVLTPTGEQIDVGTGGGVLGGLLELRDRIMPAAADELGNLFAGLANALNAVSNSGSAVPAPSVLTGRPTGLDGGDSLGFSGTTVFAVTDASGVVVARTAVDFTALGAGATIDDAVSAINAGLGGAATASFVAGTLSLTATTPNTGVAIADDSTMPGTRSGMGFSHFFGMNDLVRTGTDPLLPAGFGLGDAHGFPAGQSVEFAIRDSAGRTVARETLSTSVGPTVGDLVADLNASPLASIGTFSLDSLGRLQLTPSSGSYSFVVVSDSTDRPGTNAQLSDLLGAGVGRTAEALESAELRSDIRSNAGKLPLARLDPAAAVGALGVAPGDTRIAGAIVDALTGLTDVPGGGKFALEREVTNFIGSTALEAARNQEAHADAVARHGDIMNRREAVSGVNIDEELAQLILFQNSYGAAARLITAATEMYDELLSIGR